MTSSGNPMDLATYVCSPQVHTISAKQNIENATYLNVNKAGSPGI